jgi:hypothetical protein
MRFTLTLVFLSVCFSGFAQYYPISEYEYRWKETSPTSIPVHPQWADYPAVVLKEYRRVALKGKKDRYLNVYFEHKKRIKIKALDKGRVPFSVITLPESLDPFYDGRNIPLGERIPDLSANYFNVRIIFFEARKILPDGTTEEIYVTDAFKVDQMEVALRAESQFRYEFNLRGLNPEDEIEIHYKYEVPYQYNWFLFKYQRIFFHGFYPVQEQEIVIETEQNQAVRYSGVAPDSSYTKKKRDFMIWKSHHLSPCAGEPGIRPSADMPHILYTIENEGLVGRSRHYLSGQWLPRNYTFSALNWRERNALWIQRVASRNIEIDAQTVKLKRFIEKHTAGIPDNQSAMKLAKLHQVITDEFEFKWDDAYFAEKDLGLEKMGSQVESGQIREISRYNLYAKLLHKLDLPFYTMYFLDARTGTLTERYHANMYFEDFAFAIPDSAGTLTVYYPKRDHFGYGPDEMPFYLASTPALTVNYSDLFFTDDYFPPLINLPGQAFPNDRSIKLIAEVNSGLNTMHGKLNVSLSGQFSTLTRSMYEWGKIDSSINPLYGKLPLYDRKVYFNGWKQTGYEHEAPFFRSYASDCQLLNAGSLLSADHYSMSLKGFFPFIFWPGFGDNPRTLPFYSDFTGSDRIEIVLRFDRSVEVRNLSEIEKSIHNPFGSFTVSVQKPHSDVVVISAIYTVNAELIAPEDAPLVTQIFESISDLQQTSLELQFFED